MWTNDCIFNLAKPIIWRLILRQIAIPKLLFFCHLHPAMNIHRGWDKSPSLSIIFGLSSKTQWLSGLYYADFISFYSPTQLCGGGTTKSNSNELPISVPLSFLIKSIRGFSHPNRCVRRSHPHVWYSKLG